MLQGLGVARFRGGGNTGWKEEAEKLKFEQDMSYSKITDIIKQKYFPVEDWQRVRERVRGHIRHTDLYHQEHKPEEQATNEKLPIVENFEPNVLTVNWKGNRIIRFGLVTDMHINSKYTQLTHLHEIYDRFEREGITHVYNIGDIDEGEQMRMGHQYECYNQGFDEHVAEIAKVYPRRNNIKTHFITGNHDASLMKRSGSNIGKAIARERSDMDYLGADCATVMLTPECPLELRHPWDGTAYAISYKAQKLIESMSGGEKPNILAIGHYHKAEYIFYRNVHCIQGGTFCAQTPFMKGRAIAANMGGWLIEIEVEDDGSIRHITPTFFPFYRAIKDDYIKWRGWE